MSVGTCISAELLPAQPEGAIAARLQSLLTQSTCARGLLAYWTLPYGWLAPQFSVPLGGNGFLCVDIHRPTDVDQLASLHQAGVNVYLYLFDVAGQTELPGTPMLPPHLMHAKTALFDLADGSSVLWTGSHNGTNRAMYGINVEASVLLTLDRNGVLYREAAAFVDAVRQRSHRFDPSLLGYYKWLQGDDSAENAIELEDALDAPIPGTTITLFGTDIEELRQLDRIDKEVIVSLTSASTRRERFYRATIEKTGHQKGISEYEPCRYAFRNGRSLPVLEPLRDVDPRVKRQSTYFVSLLLNELMPDSTRAFAPPEKRQWEPVENGYLADRLPDRSRSGRRRDKDRAPVLRKAAPPEVFFHTEKNLETRRREKQSKLVTRVVLNAHEKNLKGKE